MPLPFWIVERVQIDGWKFRTVFQITCPRCHESVLVPLSWRRKNKYGTAPCLICFGTSRVPGRQQRSITR